MWIRSVRADANFNFNYTSHLELRFLGCTTRHAQGQYLVVYNHIFLSCAVMQLNY